MNNGIGQFLIRMLDEQKQRAEEKYENEPKPEHLLEIEVRTVGSDFVSLVPSFCVPAEYHTHPL
jgi:hypothetical protein